MELPIIRIGNSKGVLLSKAILKKYHIKDIIEIILEKDHIILKPIAVPKKGWEKAFKEMHKNGDEQLLMDCVFEVED